MEPFILGRQTSIFNQILAEMRDATIQQDRQRFRFNMERASELLAYEISRQLTYTPREVTTPLGELEAPVLAEQPVLAAILRAAVPMLNGFLRLFDRSDSGFVSAYRQHTSENQFEIRVEYISLPDVTDRALILLDPMIASGKSMLLSYQEIIKYSRPREVFFCGLIASEEGLDYLRRKAPEAKIFVGAVDTEMTAKSYIVPGLGDAGDLAFGVKQ